jgi:predicted ATPase
MTIIQEPTWEFVGRNDVLSDLKNQLNLSIEGKGQFTLISGEAGIGKTRLLSELKNHAKLKNVGCLEGNCIYHDISDPYLPFIEALSGITEPKFVDDSQSHVMINEAFLINDAGKVVSYASRNGANIMDEDIVGGMLSAVEAFVRDAFGDGESNSEGLDTLVYGPIRIYIEHGKGIFLAVVLSGEEPEGIRDDMKKTVNNIENKFYDILKDWDGNLAKVSKINEIIENQTKIKYRIKRGIRDIDIKREKDRVFERVLKLLKKSSEEDPILLILEDLHWADSSSLQLLSYIARNTKDSKILICGTYRPEELDDLKDKNIHPLKEAILRMSSQKLFNSMELNRLSVQDVNKMLTSRFTHSKLPREFLMQLYKETEGNPFFIEELVRVFEEEGIIYYKEGIWHIKKISEVNIPSTIKDLVELRIKRLDKDSMETIKQAAVMGREFDFEVLSMTMDNEKEKIIASLETLEEKKLIMTDDYDDETYKFSHSMIREIIYKAVSKPRKRMMHERIGRTIEKQNTKNLDLVIYQLAYHFSNTKDSDKTLEYAISAGEKASLGFALNEACNFYELAQNAIYNMADSIENKMKNLNIQTHLGDICYVIGEWDLALEYYTNMQTLSKELGNESKKAEALRSRGLIYSNKNDWELAFDNLKTSLQISNKIMDKQGIADTYYSLGTVYEKKGEFKEAQRHYKESMEHALKFKDNKQIARAYLGAGRVYAQKGQYNDSVDSFKKAVDILKTRADLDELAKIYANLGATYNFMDIDCAIGYHNKVIELTQKTQNIRMEGYALMNLSHCLIVKNAPINDVTRNLNKALDIFEKLDEKMAISTTYVNYGNLYKHQGKWDHSMEYFEKALKICKELDVPYYLGISLYEYGLMFKEKGDDINANSKFTESLKIFNKIQNREMIEKVKKEMDNNL